MQVFQKVVFLLFLLLLLTACDQVINNATAEFVKTNLEDTCGLHDNECIDAVKNQFDSCHENSEARWDEYMLANSAKEEELLDIYLTKIYTCIVNENGESYFVYNPG